MIRSQKPIEIVSLNVSGESEGMQTSPFVARSAAPLLARRDGSEVGPTASMPRLRIGEGNVRALDVDRLVVEEPLEIRIGSHPIAVLMRTPGHDEELATGFALTERLFDSPSDLARVTSCSIGSGENVMVLLPRPEAEVDPRKLSRNLYTTSSCGVCGKQSLSRALGTAPPLDDSATFEVDRLPRWPSLLRKAQPIFEETGALHAAGLFSKGEDFLCVREDVGRHNAVDKVIGWARRNEQQLDRLGLVVSGRCSFEIVQKSLAARIPLIVAVGGVSSLAVELAEAGGITLIGFARSESMNVYSHPERLV